MSTSIENPTLPGENGAPCPQPTAPQAAENSQAVRVTGLDFSPRRRKETLLAEIAELSLEGHSSRAIGRKLGVPRRTVDRWLRELRRQWAARAAESAAGLFAVAMARLETVYRQAMEAWRRSLEDKQVTVEAPGGDGDEKAKFSLRKTTQSGQAALLGKAIHAAREIARFHAQHLERACEAQETDRCHVRYDLVDELRGLPKEAFREIRDLLRLGAVTPLPEPIKLAEELSKLSGVEYRKLRTVLWDHSERELPPRGRMKAEG